MLCINFDAGKYSRIAQELLALCGAHIEPSSTGIGVENFVTVSYTHLDVYKRQVFVQHQIKDHAVAGAVGAQSGKVVQRIFHIVLHDAVGAPQYSAGSCGQLSG